MKKSLVIFALLGLFASCSDSDVVLETGEDLSNADGESYVIPIDSALSYLDAFLCDEETNPVSRSGRKRVVSSVVPVRYKLFGASRSTEDAPENIVYVANFEDGEGYAILAADSRIEDKVIAVTDNGNLSSFDVVKAADELEDKNIFVEGYPTTGSGFIQLPEYGGEIFFNPNTVELYDSNRDDTLVGNFSDDDEGAFDEEGNPIKQMTETSEISSELFTASLCMTYAVGAIDDNRNVDFVRQDDGKTIIKGDGSDPRDCTGGNGVSYSQWEIVQEVRPMLGQYTSWRQETPFNDYYPTRRKYIFFGHRKHAPAGCFPLAMAKLFTYFRYPNNVVYNGFKVNWHELNSFYFYPPTKYVNYMSDEWNKSAASLLKVIDNGCDSWHFYSGTFTWPKNATAFMRTVGYYNSHSYEYDFNRVKEMLDDKCPLLIYSIPHWCVTKSHCWNIDGYKIKERKKIMNYATKMETMNMVHCDFGWSGKCNGYYASGVFRLNDKNFESDGYDNGKKHTHYNNLLKIITYTKPVN